MQFGTLSEANKLLLDHKAKYSDTLDRICYQNIPEGEGFVKYLKSKGEGLELFFSASPYSENIDYGIQLVSSYLDDKKLKVPCEGLLATQLQMGWENVSSEKNLHGVIALACLIEGGTSHFFEGCSLKTFSGSMRKRTNPN